MTEVVFWLLTGVGVGFVVAHTWELLLGGFLLWLTVEAPLLFLGSSLSLPDGREGEAPSAIAVLRWFVRTGLVILCALVTWIVVPFREHWSTLAENPQSGPIVAAAAVCALLSFVLMLWIDPLNRLLRNILRESREIRKETKELTPNS